MRKISQGFEAAYISTLFAMAITGLAAAGGPPIDLATFARASYVYIATVRKDGNQSRAVPVWFLTDGASRILIDTNSDSWKARRIRRGSPVIVWLGSRSGPAFLGEAEFVSDRAVQEEMIKRIPQKYLLARIGLFGPKRSNFDSGKIVTIRIKPERALPAGFESEPGTAAPTLSGESR